MPSVLIVMSDYGHDPTETAVPYRAFKNAGWTVNFATEFGDGPRCDELMLSGWTQRILGATQDTCLAYNAMLQDPAALAPHSWSNESFSFMRYDVVLFPGGHEQSVRQLIESTRVHALLAEFWPHTLNASPSKKVVAAICHGVLVPALSMDSEGRSLLFECDTTTLPNFFENVAYYGTVLVLGNYYKTFGNDSPNCEEMVKQGLRYPAEQFKSSILPNPFVVKDVKRRYVSGRYPADAELLAKEVINMFSA